jgi:hypothetical protein
MNNEAVKNGFYAVANASKFRALRGIWVPAIYWAFLVAEELNSDKDIKESKLVTAIEIDATGEEFSVETRRRTGKIVRVKLNKKRVKTRRHTSTTKTGTKKKTFIRVDTQGTVSKQDPTEILSEQDTTSHFQASYNKYANHVSSRKYGLGFERVRNVENQENNSDIGNTNNQPTAAELTPVHKPKIDLDCNKDIKELLTGIIDAEALENDNLFIEEASFEELRERIRKLGMAYQKQTNKSTYEHLTQGDDPFSQQTDLKKKYEPSLDRFCLPLNKRALQAVIGTALKIESEYETGIFQLTNFGGSADKVNGKKLVAIVPSTTREGLQKNGKRWMPAFYEAIAASDNLDRYTITYNMILLHRRHCKDAFDDACLAKGPKRVGFKLDPHRQIAMCYQANLNFEHLRVMRPFLNADGCNPFNSERQMRKMRVSQSIAPVFSTLLEEGEKRHAWYLPADEVVKEEVAKASSNIEEIHVVFSADHGQRAFRCHLTALAIAGKKLILEEHRLVGQIQCKKDTYQVLSDSGIVGGLNASLKALQTIVLPGSTRPIPVKLKGVGDLAWYSLACGKSGMSGIHCWRCMAMGKEFQKDPFFLGEPWTLEKMKDRFDKLERKELSRANKNVERGLVKPMLIDCIEPEDWIVPVLHAVVLLTNTVFKHLQLWIWYRVEDVAIDLVLARMDYAKAVIAKEERWGEVLEQSAHVEEMKAELQALTPAVGEGYDDDDHEEEHRLQTTILKSAEKALVAAEKKHLIADKAKTAAKKRLNSLEKSKDHGKTKQDLWLSIQRMLRAEFNVYMSTYHGGALEGNQARTLLQKAPEVMARLEEMLLEHLDSLPAEERSKRSSIEEVGLFVMGFQRLLQYMDLIAHYCYQPFGSMSDSDVEDAKNAIRMGTLLWHKLMPTIPMKVHAWQHLAEDLAKYRGMKAHNEEQMERCHQTGLKDEHRLHAVRNFEVKTNSILSSRATVVQQGVQDMLEDTEAKRKKRKRALETKASVQQRVRKEYLESILLLPSIEDDFPSMLELNVALQRKLSAELHGRGSGESEDEESVHTD